MPRLYEFGPFQLDCIRRVLFREQVPVPLTAKAFSLLQVLVDHQGTTVDKTTLLAVVWSGSIVEENTLTRTISMVRKALGETPGEHEYVVTEPGHGYRFVATVREADSETTTAAFISAGIQPRRKLTLVTAIAALTVIGMVMITRLPRSETSATGWTPVRVTAHGQVIRATISPDGRVVAYTSGVPGHEAVLLHNPASGTTTEVIPKDAVHYLGLTFSPRAPLLLYAIAKRTGAASALWRIDLETGERQKLLEDLDSPITFSPDGLRFAFIRPRQAPAETTLIVAGADGRSETIAGREAEWLDYPAWSPDGKLIACTVVSRARGDVRIVAFDTSSGNFRPLATRTWGYVVGLAWIDRHTITFSAREAGREVYRLWQLSVDSGEARPITNELTYLEGASATRDGSRIASVQQQTLSAVWVVRSPTDRRQITADSPSHANAMPDGLQDSAGRTRCSRKIPSLNHQPRRNGTPGTRHRAHRL